MSEAFYEAMKEGVKSQKSHQSMNSRFETAFCNDCRQLLPSSQFARRAKSKNGVQPRCLDCASKRIKRWKDKKKCEELKKLVNQCKETSS